MKRNERLVRPCKIKLKKSLFSIMRLDWWLYTTDPVFLLHKKTSDNWYLPEALIIEGDFGRPVTDRKTIILF